MFNLFKKHPVSVDESLIERVRVIYKKFDDLHVMDNVNLSIVIDAHSLFAQLTKFTGPLKDEYEFRRRLISPRRDSINDVCTFEEKIVSTSEWLDAQQSITAGQALDILHNLYFCIYLHSFSRKVTQVLAEIDVYCTKVEKNGLI